MDNPSAVVEPAVLTQLPGGNTGIRTGDEFVVMDNSGLASNWLRDNELATILGDPSLTNVRKVVILDSCYSGGFIPDIQNANVSNVAVLAASAEGDLGASSADGQGWGVFSAALMSGLFRVNGTMQADLNADGELTVDEWGSFANNLDRPDVKFYNPYGDLVSYADLLGQNLSLRDDLVMLEGERANFNGLDVTAYKSPDFRDGLNDLFPDVLAGDFNFNGVVDAADYVLWRKGLGTIYTQADYNAWRANFGQAIGSGSFVNGSVPEPRSVVTLLVGILAMFNCRHRIIFDVKSSHLAVNRRKQLSVDTDAALCSRSLFFGAIGRAC